MPSPQPSHGKEQVHGAICKFWSCGGVLGPSSKFFPFPQVTKGAAYVADADCLLAIGRAGPDLPRKSAALSFEQGGFPPARDVPILSYAVNPPTKSLDFRGFDPSIFLKLRGRNSRSTVGFP